MWVPKTAAELELAISDNALPPESATYEYKQQLPPTGKNTDIAIDVSAMTVDGGVIIYGVGEDKPTGSFFKSPLPLQGAIERLSQTIESNVKERPDFAARPLRIEGDTANGYVVVEIPPSDRAPHMVEVKDEYRFYGRATGGNRKLTQTETEQLYERRRRVEQETHKSLDDAIALAPIEPAIGRGDLHLVARPLLSDRELRSRVFTDDDGGELRQAILNATNALRFADPWSPDFSQIVSASYPHRTLDGVDIVVYPIETAGEEPNNRYTSRLEFLDDGMVRHFRAQVAEPFALKADSEPFYVLREPALTQMCAQFILMVGQLLRRGGYQGQVDLFMAITGAKGAQSASWYMGTGYERYFVGHQARTVMPNNDFRGHTRTSADRMLSEPTGVAAQLGARLGRLLRPPQLADPLRLRP